MYSSSSGSFAVPRTIVDPTILGDLSEDKKAVLIGVNDQLIGMTDNFNFKNTILSVFKTILLESPENPMKEALQSLNDDLINLSLSFQSAPQEYKDGLAWSLALDVFSETLMGCLKAEPGVTSAPLKDLNERISALASWGALDVVISDANDKKLEYRSYLKDGEGPLKRFLQLCSAIDPALSKIQGRLKFEWKEEIQKPQCVQILSEKLKKIWELSKAINITRDSIIEKISSKRLPKEELESVFASAKVLVNAGDIGKLEALEGHFESLNARLGQMLSLTERTPSFGSSLTIGYIREFLSSPDSRLLEPKARVNKNQIKTTLAFSSSALGIGGLIAGSLLLGSLVAATGGFAALLILCVALAMVLAPMITLAGDYLDQKKQGLSYFSRTQLFAPPSETSATPVLGGPEGPSHSQ